MSCTVTNTQTVLNWLKVIDAVICYSILPNETLYSCIFALCRTVNREVYCEASWKIMKNLLGTNLGHACLLTMCNILTDRRFNEEAYEVLRGAVFHINMGLWGSTGSGVPMLKCSPGTVLLSFLAALDNRHIIVTYEVILSIQRLIQKSGTELPEHSWDVICDILVATSNNVEFYERNGLSKGHSVSKHFHETIDAIEMMLQRDEIAVEPERIYAIVEKVSEDRPEASVLRLMEYRTMRLSATRPQWLQSVHDFIEKFYHKMTKTSIRVKVVQSLMQLMESNRAGYEEEILDRIVLPIFSGVATDPDLAVRSAVARMLVDFTLHCETKRCTELLDIIDRLLNRPFDLHASSHPQFFEHEADVQDLIVLVEGLIKIFLKKLYHLPSAHAVRVYHLLIGHLELHYNRPYVIMASTAIKYKIFTWMLHGRANASFQIGYPDAATNHRTVKFSHYLGIEGPHQQAYAAALQERTNADGMSSSSTGASTITNFSTISIRRGCKVIVRCLEGDHDWPVVQLILTELPNIMQNKALIQGNDVDALAKTLYVMYFNESICDKYVASVAKPTMSDVKSLILPAIASLATYHQYIDPITQKGIVDALQKGLFSRIPKHCVQALTVMILEMSDTLVRLLPVVLWEMTRMSNTVQVAIPVLEFLSTLSRLPNHRFNNFVMTQYMYVFAISIPYTNPDRYDHYIVSLAHHVIAGWFLKCRLTLRRNLVNYIIASLESNIRMQFQDQKTKVEFVVAAPVVNEDSSNRKRSSSLTEQGSRRRERPNLPNPKQKSEMYGFHIELVETCIDFMARHTYSPCSALPKRLPTADYLLKGGQSMTWLVGHSLVTITTSGCSGSPCKNGFCDHCSALCKSNVSQTMAHGSAGTKSEAATPLSPESSSVSSGGKPGGDSDHKRYTKASLQHSSANDSESTDLTSSTSSSIAQPPGGRFVRQSSTDGRYSSSSGSLEALSRRGSNPDTPGDQPAEPAASKYESPFKNSTFGNTLILPQMATPQPTSDRPRELCACLCTGWAEICIRRPTGSMSWVMRIQNQISYDSFTNEFPLHDLTSLFTPSLGGGITGSTFLEPFQVRVEKPEKSVSISEKLSEIRDPNYEDDAVADMQQTQSVGLKHHDEEQQPLNKEVKEVVFKALPTKRSTRSTSDEPMVMSSSSASGPIDIPVQKGDLKMNPFDEFDDSDDRSNEHSGCEDDENIEYDENEASRARNPVRRVNSSPEMSSSWRAPYFNSKDLNASLVVAGGGHKGGSSGMDSHYGVGGGDHCEYPTTMEMQQQQQKPKKINYTKDTRVSCEAIPEEIAGSTPPSLTNSFIKDSTVPQPSALAMLSTINSTSVLISSASLPEEVDGAGLSTQSPIVVPKKQLSADDAIMQHQSSSTVPFTAQTNKIPETNPVLNINLKIPIEMPKVTAKPPPSPVPLSPRLLARNAANKIALNSGPQFPSGSSGSSATTSNETNNTGTENNIDAPRGRSKTISVVREHYGPDNLKWTLKSNANNSRFRQEQQQQPTASRSGISPSFVFLQLYHTGQLNVTERPLLVDSTNIKAITVLDYIPPFETHTIGVLYVGPGQCNSETEILKNRFGSMRYAEFLRNLGTLVAIKDAKEHNLFINMESGDDGNFTYIWTDDIVQVTFHVATLMPNKAKDPNCTEKKKHIGNNFVTIVYNESGEDYNLNTIRGQFNYACVIVQPLELNTNKVFVIAKDDIEPIVCQSCAKIVSDNSAPLLARQLALHANLASKVSKSLNIKNQSPYASNWLERLRKIKHLRTKLLDAHKAKQTDQHGRSGGSGGGGGSSSNDLSSSSSSSGQKRSYMSDFTDFT